MAIAALSDEELSWVTGLSAGDLASLRANHDAGSRWERLAIRLAGNLSPATSEILRYRLTTYARYALLIAAEPDWSFGVRMLRQTVLTAQRLSRQDDIDACHGPAPSTGNRGWDAVIAGVAMMTGLDRVSDVAILAWCDDPTRYCTELFDPLDVGKYRWLDYLRTPIQLRVRNVILAAGNLQGV